jgi:hypothetical protein
MNKNGVFKASRIFRVFRGLNAEEVLRRLGERAAYKNEPRLLAVLAVLVCGWWLVVKRGCGPFSQSRVRPWRLSSL